MRRRKRVYECTSVRIPPYLIRLVVEPALGLLGVLVGHVGGRVLLPGAYTRSLFSST
jgi:hypothetical protein